MRPETMAAIRVKSKEEIVEQLKELIKRHRRKYFKRHMRPCPENCKLGVLNRNRVTGCKGCGSRNPELCTSPTQFEPWADKDTLYQEFAAGLRDPEVVLREYRDLAILYWVLGAFDGDAPDEQVVQEAETRKEV
jgi:hypothetical protein